MPWVKNVGPSGGGGGRQGLRRGLRRLQPPAQPPPLAGSPATPRLLSTVARERCPAALARCHLHTTERPDPTRPTSCTDAAQRVLRRIHDTSVASSPWTTYTPPATRGAAAPAMATAGFADAAHKEKTKNPSIGEWGSSSSQAAVCGVLPPLAAAGAPGSEHPACTVRLAHNAGSRTPGPCPGATARRPPAHRLAVSTLTELLLLSSSIPGVLARPGRLQPWLGAAGRGAIRMS